jgi:uncharacterized membrane protein YcaP (DUF421 family)
MANLLMKIIVIPLIVVVMAWLLPNVDYGPLYEPIVVGLIVAAAGIAMEYLMLRRGTVWMSTLADFVASVVIIYIVSNLFTDANVTFPGAVLVGIVIGVVEYFMHVFLVQSGKTRKSPAT